MLLSIACFSINSLTLKSLSQSDVSPWVALLFRASVGMVVVATVFRAGHQVSFRRAMTDRMLASRGLLGVLGTVAYYFTIAKLGPGKATLISNTYVVIAARQHTDVFEWGHRSTPFALAAEIQRRLLPLSYTCEAGQFTLAGWLEPAASRMASRFLRHCSVWAAALVPASSPVAGAVAP